MNIYLLADGISEDIYSAETTLGISNHPSLDALTTLQYFGLYEPACRPGVPNPETYVVFPYFFGLQPQHNPGRAGLELLGANIDIREYPILSIYRLIPQEYDVRRGWDKAQQAPDAQLTYDLVERIKEEFPQTRTMKSVISSKGNVWCVGAHNKETFEDYLNVLQFEASKVGLNMYPLIMEEYEPGEDKLVRPTTFFGWSFGSLIDAFSLMGMKNKQSPHIIEKDLFHYEKKLQDFETHILPALKQSSTLDMSSVIYVKEGSTASRKKERTDKTLAIEFVDTLVKRIFESFDGQNVNLVFLVDHQSNMFVERNLPGPALYAYGNLARRGTSQARFTEKNILQINPEILAQKELIRQINGVIQS